MSSAGEKATYIKFNKDLKEGHLNNFVVLTGQETYLISWAVNSIINKYIDDNMGDVNCERVETQDLPKGKEVSSLLEKAAIPPMFGEHRVIVCYDMEESRIKELFKHVDEVDDSTYLIITADRIGNVGKNKKYIYDFNKLDRGQLLGFIKKRLEEKGFEADKVLVNRIAEQCGYIPLTNFRQKDNGYDLFSLEHDIHKIIYHSDGKSIRNEDIEAGLIKTLESKVFDMLDNIVIGKKEKAFSLLSQMLMLGEEPYGILTMLVSHLERITVIKEYKEHGMTNDGIVKETGLKPFVVEKAVNISGHYRLEKLMASLKKAYETDLVFKEGIMDKTLALETLIVGI